MKKPQIYSLCFVAYPDPSFDWLLFMFFYPTDDPSRRQQLLEILKRGIKKKEIVEDIDVPCYNTFGKPIEDCPASYENKVCIGEGFMNAFTLLSILEMYRF